MSKKSRNVNAKAIIWFTFAMILIFTFGNCTKGKETGGTNGDSIVYVHDTITVDSIAYVHDTITVMHEGEFTFNLPCKAVYINQEKEGKSLLFIWLHGGVKDRKLHDLFGFSHLDCCAADDSVLNYLQEKNIKSIALFPICHKAQNQNCVKWIDCYEDVMKMVRDFVDKDVVDSMRIFLAGSSDGGTGTWDFLEKNENLYAAAMPMSCGNPRKTTIPVYFFNTRQESNCSTLVESLNRQGCNIKYKHCPDSRHGQDDVECTHEFLDIFFSNIKK